MQFSTHVKEELQRGIAAIEQMEAIVDPLPNDTNASIMGFFGAHGDKATDIADLLERNKQRLDEYVANAYPEE